MRQLPCMIQAQQTELNSYNEPVSTGFVDVGSVVADIQPLSGSRVREMPGVTEKSTHRLFTLSKLTAGNYISQGDERYLVEYVQDWQTHREAILEAVK